MRQQCSAAPDARRDGAVKVLTPCGHCGRTDIYEAGCLKCVVLAIARMGARADVVTFSDPGDAFRWSKLIEAYEEKSKEVI